MISVMIMAAVQVWRIQDLFPILNSIKLQYIAPAVGLIAIVADSDPRRQVRRLGGPLLYRILGVAVMVVCSIPTSLWAGESFTFLWNDYSKTLLLLIAMAASIRSVKDLERYAVMHITGAVLYCHSMLTTFTVSRSGRLGGLLYYDANDLGLLLVATIPFCVYFLRPQARPATRLASTAVLGLLVYTLVKTGSRGGFIALVACAVYLLFNFDAIKKTVRLYAVGTMLIFMVMFGGARYWELMASILTPTADYNWTHDSGRKQIWIRGVGYMLQRPFTGVGAKAFEQAEGMISDISVRQQYGIGVKWSTAHNSFVQVGAELGVIGLTLFLAALYTAWRFLRDIGTPRLSQQAGALGPYCHALAGALIAYCVAGFFVSAGYSSFLYTLFALVLGAMKVVPVELSGPPAVGARPSSVRAVVAATGGIRRRPEARPVSGYQDLRFPPRRQAT